MSERGLSAYFQDPLGIEAAVEFDEFGNESGPTSLMIGTEPGTVVAMEVFKEVDVVAPEGITLERFCAAIDGSNLVTRLPSAFAYFLMSWAPRRMESFRLVQRPQFEIG